jgi:hypothetical protein
MAGFDAGPQHLLEHREQPPIKFGKVKYANVAAFQAGTGIGPSSFGADPRFVDAAHGDFHLRADSPAIDAATSSVPGWELLDADGLMRMDAPDTPNTGAGPVGFADRGAYEYQGSVLAVGDREGAVSLALSAAFPNPSRRAVAFTLRLGSAADVSFAVYDVAGREVWSERGVPPRGQQHAALAAHRRRRRTRAERPLPGPGAARQPGRDREVHGRALTWGQRGASSSRPRAISAM